MPAHKNVNRKRRKRKKNSEFHLTNDEEELIKRIIHEKMIETRSDANYEDQVVWTAFFRLNTVLEENASLDPSRRKQIIDKYLSFIFPNRR
ncbi:MAG: hypothetical protein ABIH20_00580 [Candidatus Diapherotrites archaeon]